MKPFVINRDSWHYKLNKNFNNDYNHYMKSWEDKRSNFCSYWRATMFRVIGVFIMSLIAVIILATIGTVIYYEPVTALIVVGPIIGIIAAIALIVFISEKIKYKKKPVDKLKPESLIVQKYRAHKSKICPTVDFK